MDEITGFFTGRLPDDWFEAAPTLTTDREEIVVVGRLAAPDLGEAEQTGPDAVRAAESGRITRWREETRRARMRIADEAEARFGRKVAWGAECGETAELFTHLAVPVMTRLRQPERLVLDTLVDAGVARSRSHALAWCVRLVGQHEGEWISRLQEALVDVEKARAEGPAA